MSYDDRSDRSNSNASNYPNAGSTVVNSRASKPNPQGPNLPREPTGPVASDSLAAESLESGGAFGQNEKGHTMGVKGASSTFNVTDTSGAKELNPAPDATSREGDEKEQYPEGVGKPQFSGVHGEHGYVGGPARHQPSTRGEYSTGQASSSGWHTSGEQHRANAAADPAPTAFSNFQKESNLKPKRKNLTEGDIPSTETVVGDVDSPNDPGRVAEKKMLSRDADSSGGGAGGSRQYGIERTTGQFDVLSSEILTHPGN